MTIILLVSTGGTITGNVKADGVYSPELVGGDLLGLVQNALDDITIRTEDFDHRLSFELDRNRWLDLVRSLREWNADPSIRGIVVSQGTALLEEVPFLASLFVDLRKPIVFTGAMLPATVGGSDAAGNLIDAVRVASHPEAASCGPVVVMGGKIVAADRIIKMHKTNRHSVAGLAGGLLGEVDSYGIHWYVAPPRPFRVFREVALADGVHLLKVSLGMDQRLTQAILKLDPAGLVIEGFPGGGGVPVSLADTVLEYVHAFPIVLTSRAREGRIVPAAGGRSGGGRLLSQGVISAGDMSAERAQLFLMACLANAETRVPGEVIAWARQLFGQYAQR